MADAPSLRASVGGNDVAGRVVGHVDLVVSRSLHLCSLWFAQYTLAFVGFAGRWLPDHLELWRTIALAPVAGWVGDHVFGVDAQLRLDSGSGDQAAIWVLVFCGLTLAAAATAVWSALDRRAPTRA